MKAKVLFLLTIAVLSLSAITLSSCSKDEDDSIHSGNTNLVGTWAEIDSPFDGKQDGFFCLYYQGRLQYFCFGISLL